MTGHAFGAATVSVLMTMFAGRYTGMPGGASAAPGAAPVPSATAQVQMQQQQQTPIAVYFSPAGGCTEAAVNEINRAQQTILVQAYSFTSAPIAKALAEARQRGLRIIVVLDKSNLTGQYTAADFVHNASIETYIDKQHAIAHNKIMLIDNRTIITGSFNFTKQAESSNAENMLVIRDNPQLFARYVANFQHHLEHSEPYTGRVQTAGAGATTEPRSRSRRAR